MNLESIDQSTNKIIEINEKPKYEFKISYKHEIKKQHLLQHLLQEQMESTRKCIGKLRKQLSNDEINNKRISRKNSNTKPFKCHWCPHTYSSRAALKQHHKLKHPEECTPITLPIEQLKLEPISQL